MPVLFRLSRTLLTIPFLAIVLIGTVRGQDVPGNLSVLSAHEEGFRPIVGTSAAGPSAGRAFLLSLVLPGLGHRYAGQGNWGRGGTFFVFADVALWTSLVGTRWRRRGLIDSYTVLATVGAGADMNGKDRTFSLRLASYRSSDEFVEVSLRNRAWEGISYVDDPSYQWEWQSNEDYLKFRELRNDSETLGRRSSVIIATLVANRLLSGFLAARATKSGREPAVGLSLSPAQSGNVPDFDLLFRF